MAASIGTLPQRPRFWIVTVHVFLAAVLWPYLIKFGVCLCLGLSSTRLAIAVPIWVLASVAVYVVAVRRSLSYLNRKFRIPSPERCIRPSIIAFGVLSLLNFFFDLALTTNSTPTPGRLIVLSTAVNFGIFVWLSIATHAGFTAMPGSGALSFSLTDILVAAGDVLIVAGSAIATIAMVFNVF